MKVKQKKPLLWWIVKLIYKIEFHQIQAFTFGDTVYCFKEINEDILSHEKVHVKQQKSSKAYAVLCFVRYVLSKKYRFKMELEACRAMKNKDWAAKVMSYPLYKFGLSYKEALKIV